jgi:hypothetical protein
MDKHRVYLEEFNIDDINAEVTIAVELSYAKRILSLGELLTWIQAQLDVHFITIDEVTHILDDLNQSINSRFSTVNDSLALKAPLASPALTDNPTIDTYRIFPATVTRTAATISASDTFAVNTIYNYTTALTSVTINTNQIPTSSTPYTFLPTVIFFRTSTSTNCTFTSNITDKSTPFADSPLVRDNRYEMHIMMGIFSMSQGVD